MSKKKLFLIVLSVIIILFGILLAVIVIKSSTQNDVEDRGAVSTIENYELFSCKTKSDIETFAQNKEYEAFFEGEYGYLYSVEMFDSLADVEIFFDENNINRIKADILLIEIPYPLEEEVSDDRSDVEFDFIAHEYTAEEKEKAQEAFDNMKGFFEEFLGCGELTQYDVLQTSLASEANIEAMSEEEQFYKGYTIREYSVKDDDGVIWLLRFSASDYYASASIIEAVDTAEYEGFVPIVDMTNKKVGEDQ